MFSVLMKSNLCSLSLKSLRGCLPATKKDKYPAYVGPITQCRYDATGDFVIPNMIRGIDHVRDPRLNKGLAFTLAERQALGIHGLLAASFKTQQEQIEICTVSLERYQNNLNKYLYLAELYDTNERLFYSLLSRDIEKFLPLVYTPTVGLACQKFGLAYRKPRGLFITIHDKGNVLNIMRNWPEHDVRAICVTDGERILGLGDLGAYGMGIPIGKLALYTMLGGVKPNQCLPIVLDVGTNTEKLKTDPLYIGIRQNRTTGPQYDEFLDEFMKACVVRYGSNTLIQFEDFAIQNATRLLDKYRNSYCTFNDDIQGTASVAVAGLLTAQRITKTKMSENVILFLGAGSASAGIANLCVDAMKEEGMKEQEAQGRIYMFDADGFLSKQRDKPIPDHAKQFAKDMPASKDFEKLVAELKATVLIGASTRGGAFKPSILQQMAKNCERPIIFALSNPTSNAECTAQEAYDNTEGRCVFASGSPFPPVNYNGKTYMTGQGNNAYVFPGIALGVICAASHQIPEKYFLDAARVCAGFVAQSDLDLGRIYPPLKDIQKVSFDIAVHIADLAYKTGFATHFPKPPDLKSFIRENIYQLEYPSALPQFYDFPAQNVQLKSIGELYPAGEISAGPAKGKPVTKT